MHLTSDRSPLCLGPGNSRCETGFVVVFFTFSVFQEGVIPTKSKKAHYHEAKHNKSLRQSRSLIREECSCDSITKAYFGFPG